MLEFFITLLMALRRSLLRIDKAPLLETFRSLKIRNFGYTPSCLQLLRKLKSNFSLFFLYSSFSYFRKSLIVTFPYFLCNIVVDIYNFSWQSKTYNCLDKNYNIFQTMPFNHTMIFFKLID